MATAYSVLGQSAPSATTATDVYTVPASTQAVVSTIAVCNSGASTTFRIAIRVAGAALAAKQYIVYDNYVNQYDSVFLTVGATLGATDVVTVYCGAATVSFTVFGSQVT